MSQTIRILGLFGLAVGYAGCGEPLQLQQVIEKSRVLAARTEVSGDPERASPRPGERATVELLVAHPSGVQAVSWALQVCPRPDVSSGVPQCEGAVIAQSIQTTPTDGAPRVEFTTPMATRLLVFGVVCTAGAPGRLSASPDWTDSAHCTDPNARALRVSFDVEVGTENRHPVLSDDLLLLDGTPWNETPASCADTQIPHVNTASTEISIGVALNSREVVNAARERITLTHFSTVGELDRPFSVIEASDAADPARTTVSLTLPTVSQDRLSRVLVVARDGRGGTQWLERALAAQKQGHAEPASGYAMCVNLAAAYADDVCLLHGGTVAAWGDWRSVMRPDVLEPVYGVSLRQVDAVDARPVFVAEPANMKHAGYTVKAGDETSQA